MNRANHMKCIRCNQLHVSNIDANCFTTENGCFEASFSCLCANEFSHYTCVEVSTGLIVQLLAISATV